MVPIEVVPLTPPHVTEVKEIGLSSPRTMLAFPPTAGPGNRAATPSAPNSTGL